MDTQPTCYPPLGYRRVDRSTWCYVDLSDGAVIGPYYRTRTELLADLERYAAHFGCAAGSPENSGQGA